MQPWFDRGVPTQQNYGLTEGVPILASPWEHARRKSRSAGTSVLYTQARVMNARLERVPPGEPGEIMLRGRSLFSGYWRNSKATDAAFVDGWFRTGDVGYTDDEGYFYIVDRIKNIVIVGSSNVYPADLESVLDESPAVFEAAVVGCPDAETGEALVACVKLREPGTVTILRQSRRPSFYEPLKAAWLRRYRDPLSCFRASEPPLQCSARLHTGHSLALHRHSELSPSTPYRPETLVSYKHDCRIRQTTAATPAKPGDLLTY